MKKGFVRVMFVCMHQLNVLTGNVFAGNDMVLLIGVLKARNLIGILFTRQNGPLGVSNSFKSAVTLNYLINNCRLKVDC